MESLEKRDKCNKKQDLNNEKKNLVNGIGVITHKYRRLHKVRKALDAKFVFFKENNSGEKWYELSYLRESIEKWESF